LIRPQTVLPEPLRIRIAKRRRQNTLQGLTNSFAGCGTGALPALWSSLGNLPELTCLYGEQDHKFAEIAARMEHAGPRITAQAIHGAGHAPHLENPETVATLLKNYLKIS
jgi:pimeloyl-ACP methyl ester carboxylesterase